MLNEWPEVFYGFYRCYVGMMPPAYSW